MKKTILILVANPQNTSSLELLPEIRNIKEAIKRSQSKDLFQVELEVAVQKKDLRRHILDIKPNIVHFCGHGTKEGLIFHDDKQPSPRSNEVIVDLLKEFNDRIECVVLNACETETLATLLKEHLNYAIGMKLEVKDNAAIAFSEGFYDALGAGENIEKAFNIGKNAVLGLDAQGNPNGRKFIYDGDNLQQHGPIPDHLIPVIKIHDKPLTEIKSIWLSPEEEKKAIKDLLREIESFHNKIKLFHTLEEITLTDQYIPIQVTLERRYKNKSENIGSYAEAEAELRKIYALKGLSEEEIKKTQEDWQKAKEKQDYIIVLADPGMGKSTLLRMEVCQTVEKSLLELDEGKALESLVIPLFMRLSSLADFCANDNENDNLEIYEAILKLVKQRYSRLLAHQENETVNRFLNDFIKKQLQAGKCLLLLDALDEVSIEKRNKLIEKLNIFVNNYSCPIIATSRIVGYGGRLIDKGKEMEIVPFTQKQTEEYITTWFNNAKDHLKDNSVNAPNLIKALKERPQLSGLAQNPLLLSLICSLYQHDQLQLPTRKGQIYEKAVNCMLSEWRIYNNRQGKSTEETEIDSKIEILTELAYQFSTQGTQILAIRKLKKIIKNYLKQNNYTNLDKEANRLIAELSNQDGVLQKLNPDKDEFIFLHRTFQEYFTALYLKYQIEEDEDRGIELVKKYFWDYDWHETITLLTGLLDKPMVLIEAIRGEKDDIFKTQLMLAGRCLGECDVIVNPIVDQIIEQIFNWWKSYPSIYLYKIVLVEIGRSYEKIVTRLLETFADSFDNSDLRLVEVLEKIGSDKAIEALLSKLYYQHNLNVRERVAKALGNIGSDKAVEPLVSLVKDKKWGLRHHLVESLAKIGSDKAIKALLSNLNHKNKYVKWSVIKELECLGFKPDDKYRDFICKMKNFKLKQIDYNKKITEWEKWYSNLQSEESEKIDYSKMDSYTVEELCSFLNHNEEYVRRRAIDTLGKIGSNRAVECLLSVLKVQGNNKLSAAFALEKLGSLTILETFIKSSDIKIYDKDIFPVARRLAIKYSKSGSSFIPVYPELISHKLN